MGRKTRVFVRDNKGRIVSNKSAPLPRSTKSGRFVKSIRPLTKPAAPPTFNEGPYDPSDLGYISTTGQRTQRQAPSPPVQQRQQQQDISIQDIENYINPALKLKGDGNCLYYTLYAGLTVIQYPNRPASATALKHQILDFIQQHADERLIGTASFRSLVEMDLQHFGVTSFEDFLHKNRSQKNIWATDVMNYAFASMYRDINLQVFQANNRHQIVMSINVNQNARSVIQVKYIDRLHFDLMSATPQAVPYSEVTNTGQLRGKQIEKLNITLNPKQIKELDQLLSKQEDARYFENNVFKVLNEKQKAQALAYKADNNEAKYLSELSKLAAQITVKDQHSMGERMNHSAQTEKYWQNKVNQEKKSRLGHLLTKKFLHTSEQVQILEEEEKIDKIVQLGQSKNISFEEAKKLVNPSPSPIKSPFQSPQATQSSPTPSPKKKKQSSSKTLTLEDLQRSVSKGIHEINYLPQPPRADRIRTMESLKNQLEPNLENPLADIAGPENLPSLRPLSKEKKVKQIGVGGKETDISDLISKAKSLQGNDDDLPEMNPISYVEPPPKTKITPRPRAPKAPAKPKSPRAPKAPAKPKAPRAPITLSMAKRPMRKQSIFNAQFKPVEAQEKQTISKLSDKKSKVTVTTRLKQFQNRSWDYRPVAGQLKNASKETGYSPSYIGQQLRRQMILKQNPALKQGNRRLNRQSFIGPQKPRNALPMVTMQMIAYKKKAKERNA